MRRRMTRLCCGIVTVVLCGQWVVAQDTNEILKYVPSDANTLTVLRIHDLTQSPRGQAEGWGEKHESEFLQGAITVPPWAEQFVRASYVRPGMRGGDWTVVLLPLPQSFDISTLATREGTEVQEISGHPAVASSRYEGYFVEFGGGESGAPKLLGGMVPATRQDAARWIRETTGRGSAPISEYLSAAVADRAAQIVLAVDLHEMLDPIMVRNRINSAAALQGNTRAQRLLVVDFQSLRGARLAIHTDQETTAEIRLDFGRTVSEAGEHIKPLLIEFLNDAGAALDELEEAQTQVQGRSVTLKMPLSDESLRRILSLVTMPPPPTAVGRQAPAAPQPNPATTTDSPNLLASQRYFNAVSRNIDDLQRAKSRATSYSQTAHWHVSFADRIDRLPTAGVEPALLKYGRDISTWLRALGASLRGTAVKVNALDRSIVYNVEQQPVFRNGFEWWWGGAHTAYGPYNVGQPVVTNVTSNLQEVRQRQAEVVQASEPEREQIWQMILEERASTERAMADKFGPDFLRR